MAKPKAIPLFARSTCPKCGTCLWLIRILARGLRFNQRTYQCPRCQYEITDTAKFGSASKMRRRLTIIVLSLVSIQFSAAHAAGYRGGNGEGQTGKPYPGDTGLPAHHNGPDVKPPKPKTSVLWPHIPPIIHGPFPGPRPGQPDPRGQ